MGMQANELKAKLARVQPGPVKVVFSAKKLSSGKSKTGLWPRVTVRLDGVEEVAALTEWGDVKVKAEDGKLTKLEIVILRLAGVESRSMRAVKRNAGLKWPLQDAVKRVHMRISSAISKAQTTQKLSTRMEGVHRKQRKSKAVLRMEQTFRDLLGGTVKLNDLTGSQVAKVWERVKMEVVVKEVHDL